MRLLLLALPASLTFLAAFVVSADPRSPKPKPDTVQSVAAGNNHFGLDLYGKLRKTEGNLFVSPFSVSSALGMTAIGANGATREQMLATLHLPAADAQRNAGFKQILAILNAENADPKKRGYELSVANALWGAKGNIWLKTFLDATAENYGAGLTELDFAKDTDGSRKTINAWVEKRTRDKIKDLIPSGALEQDTQLVLTNAIYFKGKWAAEFDKKATFDEPFLNAPGKAEKVPMMHKSDSFRYAETDDFQTLVLPYKGDELSMVVFLPKKKLGLDNLENKFTAENVAKWLKSPQFVETVQVSLPKFKVESTFELKEPLAAMGMIDLFTRNADLSGMTGSPGLMVSKVIHKTFVDVNEEGTEAAAATAVIVTPTSIELNPKPIPVFKADHPFAFVIHDHRTDTILFMGRVANPAK